MSEDSEYIPSNDEISSESCKTSDKSEDSDNSDVSQENNTRRKVVGKVLKPLLRRQVQSTPRKTRRGHKTVAYKDYVSWD